LERVDLRALGAVATLGLLLVASRLYFMVEKAYCDVFGVPVARRNLALRMLSFYFCMTAGPIAMVGVLRGSFLLFTDLGVSGAADLPAQLMQYAVLVAALKLLPATQVRWRPALLGALVSHGLIEFGRWGLETYVAWVAGADALSQVYGSLGFVPIFLMWVYLLWVFVLLGVEVAQVFQNYATLVEKELEQLDGGPSWPSAETALRVAAWVGWGFIHGRGPVTVSDLAERSGVDARTLHPVLDVLAGAGLVVYANSGWLLARPAARIQLREVVSAWRTRDGSVDEADGLRVEFTEAIQLDGTLADGISRWLPPPGESVDVRRAIRTSLGRP